MMGNGAIGVVGAEGIIIIGFCWKFMQKIGSAAGQCESPVSGANEGSSYCSLLVQHVSST